MVKSKIVVAALMLVFSTMPAFAAPGDMLASTFLEKADRLMAMGVRAMFSGDVKVLMAEGKGAGEAYRLRMVADKAAGRPPHSCAPPRTRMNSDQLLNHLRSYPPAQRQSTTMKVAMADYFARTYPCPRAG